MIEADQNLRDRLERNHQTVFLSMDLKFSRVETPKEN